MNSRMHYLWYNKKLKNLLSKWPCGAVFNTTHALNCHNGGFVNARHDNIINTEYNLLKSVCQDVETEPLLQKVENVENYPRCTIITDEARLDCAQGFWRTGQNTFFDVWVTNPNCDSQRNMTLKSITRKHELEKKWNYNKNVMEVEYGSFTPLVFTTSGVMGHDCSIYHKSLAQKISNKRKEKYEDIIRS